MPAKAGKGAVRGGNRKIHAVKPKKGIEGGDIKVKRSNTGCGGQKSLKGKIEGDTE